MAINLAHMAAVMNIVSVPFTRGTPPWPRISANPNVNIFRFSPLHEGDTSVALKFPAFWLAFLKFQSPSRGGHLRGYHALGYSHAANVSFSPLHEGDTSVAVHASDGSNPGLKFQSPSRGGHLRGARRAPRPESQLGFQSPSRGGHLRGSRCGGNSASGF